MPSLGSLVVNIKANAGQFNRTMGQAERRAESFGSKMRVVGAAAAAGIGAATGVVAALGAQLQRLDEVAKQAAKLGAAANDLLGLQHAFELTGVSVQTGTTALQRFVKNVALAAAGAGPGKKALEELGLSAQQLMGLSLPERLGEFGNALARIKNPADKLRLTVALMDSEGAALVNTLSGGSAALRQMVKEWERLHGGITEADLQKVQDANDAWTRIKTTLQGVADAAAIATVRLSGNLSKVFRATGLKQGPNRRDFFEVLAQREEERQAAQRAATQNRQRQARVRIQQLSGHQIKNFVENLGQSIKARAGTAGAVFQDLAQRASAATSLRDARLAFRISQAQELVNATRPAVGGGARFAGIAQRGSQEALSTIFGTRSPVERSLEEHKKANATLKALLEEQRRNRAESLGITLQGGV